MRRYLPEHGTRNEYQNFGCRCCACCEANTAYCKTAKLRRQERGTVPHGTSSGYTNWNCRCEACKAAYWTPHRRAQLRAAQRRYYARQKAAS